MRNTGKEGADFQRRYLEAGGITGGRNVAAMTQQEKQRNLLELDPTRWTWTGVGIGGIAGAALGSLAAGPIGGVIGAALGGYGARSGQVVQLVEAVENMTRYGAAAHAYREAKRNNPQLTEQEAMAEAAYVARDIFDWNRRGSKTLAFLRMVTFLNAQVQGLDRAARGIAATGDRGSAVQKQMRIVWRNEQGLALSADEKRDLAQAYKLYWRLGLYTLGLVGLYALFANDPEYEDILDKSKFTHTWLPNTLGVDIRIPSAFEWAWPAVVAQIIADDISEKDPNGLSRFAHSVQELFVPPAVPQAATLYMGWMTGVDRDAFGEEARDIIGMGQTGLEPERQFNAYTGMMARDITAAMAAIGLPRSMIPSAQVVHWSLMTGGYWSRDINTAYDKIREAATGKIGRDTRPQEAIILSGFLGNAARTSKSIKNFWQMASRSGGEYRVVSNQYKSFKKKGVQNQGIEYLHRQDEEHRDYALLEGEFKIDQKVMHPLNRMMRMNRVLTHLTHDVIENKISLGKRLRRKPEQLDPSNLIAADSKTKAALMTIIEKLRRAEAWNTMVVMNRDGWIGKKEFDADAIMRLMEAQAPEVHAALMVRMGEARVHDMETIKTAWPALRDQIRAQYPDAY
jgi:hypothetical protein